jgi:hypothetical protein
MNRTPPGTHRYGNFRDPAGLVWRMLGSGDRAAYSALARAVLMVVLRPLDLMLRSGERRRLRAAEGQTPRPLFLIVGAPRSGTTLVYQLLARFCEVCYFTNLAALFPGAPLSASRLLGAWFRQGRADFHSFYGQTAGLSGPNDAFELWNRWLGPDRYAVPDELPPETIQSMRTCFAAWTNEFARPFLNKNNRNTLCLTLLARALPETRFIVVRRDPFFVAQSLILARARIQGSKTYGWGLASRDTQALDEPLAYVDDVCTQVLAIERQLDQQLERIPPERVWQLSYEELCEHPGAQLLELQTRFPEITLRVPFIEKELRPLCVARDVLLTGAEAERVRTRLSAARHSEDNPACANHPRVGPGTVDARAAELSPLAESRRPTGPPR